jgi:hypothetical protein
MTKTEDMAVPEMVERVARAIHTQRNGTPKLWIIVTPEKRNEYRGYAAVAIQAMIEAIAERSPEVILKAVLSEALRASLQTKGEK